MTHQEFREIDGRMVELFPVNATMTFDIRLEFPEYVVEGEFNVPYCGSPEELGALAKALQELLAEPLIVGCKPSKKEDKDAFIRMLTVLYNHMVLTWRV